jgi:hypothetical protein
MRLSDDIDGALTKKFEKRTDSSHVFICGLARAGTTMLMRAFYETGQFRSLTYRDMPFVLMPSVWRTLTQTFQKRGSLQQRAHGDGIKVDFDSPEAFEEVFWRTYAGQDYIHDNYLVPHVASEDLIAKFCDYVGRIIQGTQGIEQDRYLSKNNNNILRLSSIHAAFPRASIIIPFRDPIEQSISLLEQHQRFCDIHQNDKFSYKYMEWLGHYEFGLTQRPFYFNEDTNLGQVGTPSKGINYWLNLWNSTYKYLLEEARGNTFFLAMKICVSSLIQD